MPISDAPRQSYHHGRLKDALIEAARELVAERGPAGFTLAEAAKRVGVTGAAPYRHFADRQALLAELSMRGFAQFGAELRQAYDGGRPDPATAFRRMGAAYLRFAQSEPGLYSAMFGPGGADPAPGADAFDILREATAAVLRSRGAERADAAALARQIWALSHGVATLAISGHFSSARQSDPAALQQAGAAGLIETAARRASAPA